jgi:hypothetical protein
VTWRGPYASGGLYNPTRGVVSYPAGVCVQSNATSTGCPVLRLDAGGSTVRTAADGTDLWAAAPCAANAFTHDDFNNAKIVGVLPYGDEARTFTATSAVDDPVTSGASCGTSAHSASVWYKYTAASSQQVRVSAVGTNHASILAVWQGTRGALTQVACNHQNAANGGNESELDFAAVNGQTYYVELAGYQSTGGGIGSVRIYPTPPGGCP